MYIGVCFGVVFDVDLSLSFFKKKRLEICNIFGRLERFNDSSVNSALSELLYLRGIVNDCKYFCSRSNKAWHIAYAP